MNKLHRKNLDRSRPDEISMRSLLLKLIAIVRFLIKRWYLPLLGATAFGSYNYIKVKRILPTFPAKVKLFVSPTKVDPNNAELVEVYARIVNTQQLLLDVFLQKVKGSNGDSLLLINHYLDTYFRINPDGLDPEIPLGFSIENESFELLTLAERNVLQKVITKASTPINDYSDGFVSMSGDYKLGLITINVSSPDAALSISLIEAVYQRSNALFKNNAVYGSNEAYSILNQESSNLSLAYKTNYYQLNKYKDKRERYLSKVTKLESSKDETQALLAVQKDIRYLEKKIHKLSVDAEVSKMAYLAVLEQEKMAQLELESNRIIVKVLEKSFAPLEAFKPSAVLSLIKGAVFGGLLISFILLFYFIYLEIKAEF